MSRPIIVKHGESGSPMLPRGSISSSDASFTGVGGGNIFSESMKEKAAVVSETVKEKATEIGIIMQARAKDTANAILLVDGYDNNLSDEQETFARSLDDASEVGSILCARGGICSASLPQPTPPHPSQVNMLTLARIMFHPPSFDAILPMLVVGAQLGVFMALGSLALFNQAELLLSAGWCPADADIFTKVGSRAHTPALNPAWARHLLWHSTQTTLTAQPHFHPDSIATSPNPPSLLAHGRSSCCVSRSCTSRDCAWLLSTSQRLPSI